MDTLIENIGFLGTAYDLDVLMENLAFLGTVYDFRVLFLGFMLIVMIDMVLKVWSMWRAARLQKKVWFIALLVVNSMGILPLIFLSLTKKEYQSLKLREAESPSPPQNPADQA